MSAEDEFHNRHPENWVGTYEARKQRMVRLVEIGAPSTVIALECFLILDAINHMGEFPDLKKYKPARCVAKVLGEAADEGRS